MNSNDKSIGILVDNQASTQPDIYSQQLLHSIFDHLDIADTTRNEYLYRITAFISYIQDFGFSTNSYIEYKRHLSQRNDFSISTKNKYLIVARLFCKELHRLGYLPVDITANIKIFQQSRKHKKIGLSEEEIQKMLHYLHSHENSKEIYRIKAILSLLILQGLRQIELVRLNRADIDFSSNYAFIQGKGRDDKEIIDLHPVTITVLKEYIKQYKIADGPLFISTSNSSKNHRLTTKSIRNIINPILRELGIDKTVHGFRHYFVTKLIQEYKGDLLTISQYTRHKNIEMLQVYNDSIKKNEDLPRYYKTFNSINFTQK